MLEWYSKFYQELYCNLSLQLFQQQFKENQDCVERGRPKYYHVHLRTNLDILDIIMDAVHIMRIIVDIIGNNWHRQLCANCDK